MTPVLLFLVFVSSFAQVYQVRTTYQNLFCNGTVLTRQGTLVDNATCATAETICIQNTKRSIDSAGGSSIVTCEATEPVSLNDGSQPDAYSGYRLYDSSTCAGQVIEFEYILVETCFRDGITVGNSSYSATCNGQTGTATLTNYLNDEFCNTTTGSNDWGDTPACVNNRTSVCNQFTPPPTEPPTLPPTLPPTFGEGTATVYDIKQICDASKELFETALGGAVSTATGVLSVCKVSKCKVINLYTAVEFRYECQSDTDADYTDAEASVICEAVNDFTNLAFSIEEPFQTTVCAEQFGDPIGSKGKIVVNGLEASGSLFQTSLLMLFAILICNLF